MTIRTWVDSFDKRTPEQRAAMHPSLQRLQEERAREEEERNREEANRPPFNPRTEVSADAKYLLRNLIIWFLILPVVLGVVLWAATH